MLLAGQAAVGCFRRAVSPRFAEFEVATLGISLILVSPFDTEPKIVL